MKTCSGPATNDHPFFSRISPSNCPFIGTWPKTCPEDWCCVKKLALGDKYISHLAVVVAVTVAVGIFITIPVIINNGFL